MNGSVFFAGFLALVMVGYVLRTYREHRRSLVKSYYVEGRQHMEDGMYEKALASYTKALKIQPKSRRLREARDDALFKVAKQYYDREVYLKALELFLQLKRVSPLYAGVDDYLGHIGDQVLADEVIQVEDIGLSKTLALLSRMGRGASYIACTRCGWKVDVASITGNPDALRCPRCGSKFTSVRIYMKDVLQHVSKRGRAGR